MDELDPAAVILWIKTHSSKFNMLEEFCLYYYFSESESDKNIFIKSQWERLPTRGTLLEYVTQHLFLGDHTLIRDIAPLLNDTTELYQIYERFLQAIEQETELRAERIMTAHVLYEV